MQHSVPYSDGGSEHLHSPLFKQILSCLPHVQEPDRQGNYKTQCLFHDEKTPSLSIHSEKGFNCFGCGAKGSIAQLGQHLGILSSEGQVSDVKNEGVDNIVHKTIYDYGEFQVVRQECGGSKRILQRRLDPQTGKWIYNKRGLKNVLYRRGEVLSATYVFVVEGEKCVEILLPKLQDREMFGVWTVTTNPGGAGKWQDEMALDLAGKHIIILPDNDEVGRHHAHQVAASVCPHVASVKIVTLPNLPSKGDVADFLDAGGSLDDILTLEQATRLWVPVAQNFETGEQQGELHSVNSVNSATTRPTEHNAVYQGLAGRVALSIAPYTEAASIAVLVSFLSGFGNMIGRYPYWSVNGSRHYPNLFVTIVGDSARARKGTSWSVIAALLREVDEGWAKGCIYTGLSSGEGLIYHVRDVVTEIQDGKVVTKDPGAKDKRLLAVEGELASLLRVSKREGNTASAQLRNGWDGVSLGILTKNNPMRATDAHISFLAHSTEFELLNLLQSNDIANGFANRILWICAQRSKKLPLGAEVPPAVQSRLVEEIRVAVIAARARQEMRFDDEAATLWNRVYDELTEEYYGRLDLVTSRAEAQTRRLAMLYALADGSAVIKVEHLTAACALWDYAFKSARYIFGSSTGNPDADAILEAIRAQGAQGMTKTEISALLHHPTAARIQKAMTLLARLNLLTEEKRSGEGRPARVYYERSQKSHSIFQSLFAPPEKTELTEKTLSEDEDWTEVKL